MDFDTFAAVSGTINGVDITDFVAGSQLCQLENAVTVSIDFAFDGLSVDNQFVRLHVNVICKGFVESQKGKLTTLGVADGIGNIGIIEAMFFSIIHISEDTFDGNFRGFSISDLRAALERGGLQKHRLAFFGDLLACVKFKGEGFAVDRFHIIKAYGAEILIP